MTDLTTSLKDSPAKASILVTGATGGIGMATTKALVKCYGMSFQYILLGRDEQKLQHLIDELCESVAFSLDICAVTIDLLHSDACKLLFSQLKSAENILLPPSHPFLFQCKPIQKLVHCAGTMSESVLMMTRDTEIHEQLQLHVVQALKLVQQVSKFMLRQQQGQIVLFSSVVAQQGSEGQVLYAAAKAAVEGIVRSASKELGKHNIRVNGIAPGVIETDMTSHFSQEKKQTLVEKTPLQRLGNPEDVAGVVSFLLSEQSAFVTGQIICVDGGITL